MSLDQKYEFFAPIWRVMRDDNMSVQEVRARHRLCKGQGGGNPMRAKPAYLGCCGAATQGLRLSSSFSGGLLYDIYLPQGYTWLYRLSPMASTSLLPARPRARRCGARSSMCPWP